MIKLKPAKMTLMQMFNLMIPAKEKGEKEMGKNVAESVMNEATISHNTNVAVAPVKEDDVKAVDGSEADALRVNPYPKQPPELTSDHNYQCWEPPIVRTSCGLIYVTWPKLEPSFGT
jgi:hypothetical protein